MAENIFPYQLPENWHWTTLENVCSFIGGGTPDKNNSNYWNGDIFWASVKDIKGDYLFNTIDKITDEGLKNSSAKLCAIGDIILVTRISPATSIISKIVTAINQDLKIVKTALPPKFLHYFFKNFKSELESMASGSTVKGITIEKIKKFPIPLPPIDEQKKIVERIESLFSKLDSAKSIVQKILDGYELRRSAILHKAFTGELTKNFRAENNLSLDDWQEKTLGAVCKINPPKISTANLSDDLEVSFFPMTSLSETEGKITNPQIKFLGEVKSGYTNFFEGDVVFAKITPCMENGKSAVIEKLVNDIGYGTTEFFVLRCNKEIFNRFLYHLVRSKKFRTEAKEVMAGAVGQQRVPKKFLSEYKISLPPLAEQKEIVRVLDSLLDKEQRTKEIAEKILQEIDLLKKSVLARAFRGEL